jgi:tetratricopeptide (TPR) repeat protein
LADFLRLEPCTYLDGLRIANANPSPVKLEEARQRLLFAQKVDPDNPIIPEYLGQVYFYRANFSSFDVQLKREFLERALENFEASIRIRPNSGYLWSSEMITRQSLMDIDAPSLAGTSAVASATPMANLDTLLVSLRHAAQLTPWEPSVVEQVIQVGKIHYTELNTNDQAIVDMAIKRAAQLGLKID